MKYWALLIGLLLLTLLSFGTGIELKGKDATSICENCQTIWIKNDRQIPAFIRFKNNAGPLPENAIDWVKGKFDIHPSFKFQIVKENTDTKGYHHLLFQLYINDIPVEYATYSVHVLNGSVQSLSGNIPKDINADFSFSLSKNDALIAAKNHVGASSYKWEMPEEEQYLKYSLGDSSATYLPNPELFLFPMKSTNDEINWHLTYRMKIYANQPESHTELYVDANSGIVIFENELIQHIDSPGVANSGYSGVVNIVSDTYMGGYRLNENGRGLGIHTWNMETRTQINSAVEFTDSDNFWDNPNLQLDQYATDAHWGAEMTYDYMLARFNRNSINGSGFRLNSYVHYDVNWNNASWNGFNMRYGDGNNRPYTTLDIAGHEIGHGLTSNTANLIYQNESGALNESFSDILGASIEFFVKGSSANWLIGEDKGIPIRNMANPNQYGDPDTYRAGQWYFGTADNGGVHINSGVQNFWYYLLTEGGSGKNDVNKNYDVTGIGILDASLIAYRNLTVYLSRNSEYDEAMYFGIQSAIDLYGSCSQQHESTVNAWYAVGLGEEYIDGVKSDFVVEQETSCQLPFIAKFVDQSTNAITYQWTFSNGKVSTQANPQVLFEDTGMYSATLVIDGGACGIDSLTKENYIDINQLEKPETTNDTVFVCSGEKATLEATTNGENIYWYDSLVDGNLIHQGLTFETDEILESKNYFLESIIHYNPRNVGPQDDQFGSTTTSSNDVSTLFDVYAPMELVSVLIYAGGTKERTIAVENSNGDIIHSKTVLVGDGEQRVDLNFQLEPGSDYELKFASSSPNVTRVEENASYPYEAPGICAITGNTAPPQHYYFYFFDWEVQLLDCTSERSQINTSIKCEVPVIPEYQGYNIYPNPSIDGFYIEFYSTYNSDMNVKMYNVNGQLVRDFQAFPFIEGNNQAYLPTVGIARGVYYLTIESSLENKTFRVIVADN